MDQQAGLTRLVAAEAYMSAALHRLTGIRREVEVGICGTAITASVDGVEARVVLAEGQTVGEALEWLSGKLYAVLNGVPTGE